MDEGTVTFGVTQDPNGVHVQMPGSPLRENHIGVSNLAFFQDEEHANNNGVDEIVSHSEVTDEDDDEEDEQAGKARRRNDEDRFDESSDLGLPSPKRSSRSSSSSTWSSPRRKMSSASAKTENREKPPAIVVTATSCSEPTSPEGRHPRFTWGSGAAANNGAKRGQGQRQGQSKAFSRRVSDVSPMRMSLGTPAQNNVPRSRSQDYQTFDYFQKNLKLKVSSAAFLGSTAVTL